MDGGDVMEVGKGGSSGKGDWEKERRKGKRMKNIERRE